MENELKRSYLQIMCFIDQHKEYDFSYSIVERDKDEDEYYKEHFMKLEMDNYNNIFCLYYLVPLDKNSSGNYIVTEELINIHKEKIKRIREILLQKYYSKWNYLETDFDKSVLKQLQVYM